MTISAAQVYRPRFGCGWYLLFKSFEATPSCSQVNTDAPMILITPENATRHLQRPPPAIVQTHQSKDKENIRRQSVGFDCPTSAD